MTLANAAKVTRPDIRSALKRNRVFSLLSSACKSPLVWIAAQGGSGKTTLVSSYLEFKKLPCLWYQMDESDSDPAAFFQYIKSAAEQMDSAAAKSLPLLTPEYVQGLNIFARRYLEGLFAILADRVCREKTAQGQAGKDEAFLEQGISDAAKDLSGESRMDKPCPAYLVLDNYQQVSESSVLHRLLASGLEMVPREVKVIIISRYQPPAQYARLRANNLMSLLGWDEIRFTLEETRKLVQGLVAQDSGSGFRHSLKPVEHDQAEIFHRITDGWAAGVVLLAERLRWGRKDMVIMEKIHPSDEIIDYFAGEVCSSMDQDMLDFLIKTSFLPQMTLQSAQAISGNRHAGSILSLLHRRNCFTEKRAVKPHIYKYHPLFRDFLINQARKVCSKNEYKSLQRHAAELLAEAGQTEEAVELLLSADMHDKAAEYILRKAGSMAAGGRGQTLKSWIGMLPVSLMDDKPWLHYWLGMCRSFFAPDEALKNFEKAFHIFINKKDDEAALTAWCGAVESILLKRGDFRQLDFWIEWMHKRLGKGLSLPAADIESRVTACMIGAILYRFPTHPHASKWLLRAEELILHGSPEISLRQFHLIMHHLMFGKTFQAGLLVKRIEPLITTSSPPFLRINWCLIKAMYFHMAEGSGERAIAMAEEGLAVARDTGIHVFDAYLLAQGVHGGLSINNMQTVRNYLDLMAAAIDGSRLWDVSYYHFLFGWKKFCEGNVRAFCEHMQLALSLVEKIGCKFSSAVGHAGLALAFLEMSDDEMCSLNLDKAEEIIPGREDTPEFLYLLIKALACFSRHREEEGIALLTRAMAIGRRHGLFTCPFWKHETMSLICAKALENGLETGYVHEIIRKRKLTPMPGKSREICLINWPYPLRIFTLGRFEIELNGRLLQSGAKSRKKALDMLKSIIAFGCREVPSQKVMDVLYPEIDGDKANYSFKFTLHQLRSLLSSGNFIVSQGGRLSLDERYCIIDAEVFLQLCSRIRKIHEICTTGYISGSEVRDRQNQIFQLSRKALDLYKGDFLQEENVGFAFASRENLKNNFLRLVDIAGAILEREGRIREAISMYERSIETDALQEKFYQRLMRCYARDGQDAAVLSVYRRLSRILDSRLGVKPSSETRNTYKNLLRI